MPALAIAPPFKVEAGFSAKPLDAIAGIAWTDLSAYARAVTWNRGRQHELNRFETGLATVTLDNVDGRFFPGNASSPYHPNLKPMRRLRLSALLYVIEVLADRASAYWRMNDASGDFLDYLGTRPLAPTGTIARQVTGATADGDTAADLDGSTGRAAYASVAADSALPGFYTPNVGEGITVEAWLKNDGLAGTDKAILIGDQGGSGTRGVTIEASGTDYRAGAVLGGSFTVIAAAPASFGVYRHVVYTLKRTATGTYEQKLYIDGAQVATGTTIAAFSPATPGTDSVHVGARLTAGPTFDQFWNGPIDDVSIYPSVLSATQVSAHYTAGATNAVARLFHGYVEDWPQNFDPGERDTVVTVTAAELGKVLNLWKFLNKYPEEVVFDLPKAYYRLGEAAPASGTQTAQDSSGNGRDGRYAQGFEAADFGVAGLLVGDSDLAANFDAIAPGSSRVEVTEPAAQIGGTGAFSLEAWIKPSASTSMAIVGQTPSQFSNVAGTIKSPRGYLLWIDGTTDKVRFQTWDTDGTTRIDLTSTVVLATGTTYHVVAVRKGDGSAELWVNNVLEASSGAASSSDLLVGKLWVGSIVDDNVGDNLAFGGTIDEVAVYPSALSSTRIGKHYTAGASGWSETTGARIGHALDIIGHPSADRALDAGKTTMSATSDLNTKKALQVIQDAVDAEGAGACYVRGDGVIEFKDRHTQLLATSVQATYGDAAAEHQYLTADVSLDDSEIWNEVRAQRVGGAEQYARDEASITDYGQRTLSKGSLELTSDDEAFQLCNYLLSRFKDPINRIRSVVFDGLAGQNAGDAGGVPWAALLRRELFKERVRIRRRPQGGVALQSIEGFVQSIAGSYDPERGLRLAWTIQPADQSTYWILGDATYGVLGSTTKLAY